MSAIPRLASTVVLVDDSFRVYLTKRPQTMKFLGGFYVFPGGAVEKTDKEVGSEFFKNYDQANTFHRSHYIAAARELFEEVGVFLAEKDGTPFRFDTEKEREYRRRLVNGELSFLDILRQEELVLDCEQLTYFGNRVTPEGNPIRFDTRFFLATLPKGQTPSPDPNEVDEAFWITLDEAIAAYDRGALPMARPTIDSLRTMVNYKKGRPLHLSKRET